MNIPVTRLQEIEAREPQFGGGNQLQEKKPSRKTAFRLFAAISPAKSRGRITFLDGNWPVNFEQIANTIQKAICRKWLLHEIIGPGGAKVGNFVLLNHPGNAKNLDAIHRSIASNTLANFAAVNVWEHHVKNDHVRPKLLDLHTCVEAIVGGSNVESPVAFEGVVHEIYQILVIVNDQQLLLSAFKGIGRNTIVFHEYKKLISWNPAESASGYTKAFERSVVKASYDRLLAHLAYLGGLAGRKNSLCAGHLGEPSFLNDLCNVDDGSPNLLARFIL